MHHWGFLYTASPLSPMRSRRPVAQRVLREHVGRLLSDSAGSIVDHAPECANVNYALQEEGRPVIPMHDEGDDGSRGNEITLCR